MGRALGGLVAGAWVLGLFACGLFQKESSVPIPPPEIPLYSQQVDSLPLLPLTPSPNPFLLRVRQQGCEGPCPEWEARFYPGGSGTLSAFRGLPLRGAYRTQVSRDTLARWVQYAADFQFFQLPDSIPASSEFLFQIPTWEIEIRQGTSSHCVVHNHHGPLILRTFEQQLENWIFSLDWEKIR